MLFGLGYPSQTVAIGGLSVVDYHDGKTPDEPPPTPITYPGRAFDAAWRSAATQRIEQYRKADLTVTVQDSSGQPVSGADVQVAMTRHTFGLGTAVNLRALTDQLPAETRERYEREVATLFNTVVFESELEWPALEGDWERPMGPTSSARASTGWRRWASAPGDMPS